MSTATATTITGSDTKINGAHGVKLPHGVGKVGDRVTVNYGFGITRTATLVRSDWMRGETVAWVVKLDPKPAPAPSAEAATPAAPMKFRGFGWNGVRYDERCRICRRVETIDNITEKCAGCSR